MDKKALDRLKTSSNSTFREKAAEIDIWKNLKHTNKENLKENLEKFLLLNVAYIEYRSKFGAVRKIVCTNNTEFIRRIQIFFSKEDKKIANLSVSNGIHCKDKNKVMSWDIKENELKSIMLNNWCILDFISLVSFAALLEKNNSKQANKQFEEIVNKIRNDFKLFI